MLSFNVCFIINKLVIKKLDLGIGLPRRRSSFLPSSIRSHDFCVVSPLRICAQLSHSCATKYSMSFSGKRVIPCPKYFIHVVYRLLKWRRESMHAG